ncbi:WxL domain-containing protein [Lacticaseibacillus mingshuiensis]|uniref:WxL domain-containing protein n=1 Tax=Lacticaseibacillus mingshuiensis TaxID=2799574 RepID=UPI00194E1612|nr:WxL domain-containing protein [Lacticaseibacillus mingshuiensis]
MKVNQLKNFFPKTVFALGLLLSLIGLAGSAHSLSIQAATAPTGTLAISDVRDSDNFYTGTQEADLYSWQPDGQDVQVNRNSVYHFADNSSITVKLTNSQAQGSVVTTGLPTGVTVDMAATKALWLATDSTTSLDATQQVLKSPVTGASLTVSGSSLQMYVATTGAAVNTLTFVVKVGAGLSSFTLTPLLAGNVTGASATWQHDVSRVTPDGNVAAYVSTWYGNADPYKVGTDFRFQLWVDNVPDDQLQANFVTAYLGPGLALDFDQLIARQSPSTNPNAGIGTILSDTTSGNTRTVVMENKSLLNKLADGTLVPVKVQISYNSVTHKITLYWLEALTSAQLANIKGYVAVMPIKVLPGGGSGGYTITPYLADVKQGTADSFNVAGDTTAAADRYYLQAVSGGTANTPVPGWRFGPGYGPKITASDGKLYNGELFLNSAMTAASSDEQLTDSNGEVSLSSVYFENRETVEPAIPWPEGAEFQFNWFQNQIYDYDKAQKIGYYTPAGYPYITLKNGYLTVSRLMNPLNGQTAAPTSTSQFDVVDSPYGGVKKMVRLHLTALKYIKVVDENGDPIDQVKVPLNDGTNTLTSTTGSLHTGGYLSTATAGQDYIQVTPGTLFPTSLSVQGSAITAKSFLSPTGKLGLTYDKTTDKLVLSNTDNLGGAATLSADGQTVTIKLQFGSTAPLNPSDPSANNDPSTNPGTGDTGRLTLDSIPKVFNFGAHDVPVGRGTYSLNGATTPTDDSLATWSLTGDGEKAPVTSVAKSNGTVVKNSAGDSVVFSQVTNRAKYRGFQLSVTGSPLTSKEGRPLKDAAIVFTQPTVQQLSNDSGTLKWTKMAPSFQVTSPSSSALPLDGESAITLMDGTPDGTLSSRGTYQTVWSLSNVKLQVPNGVLATDYKADLTWTLVSAPED